MGYVVIHTYQHPLCWAFNVYTLYSNYVFVLKTNIKRQMHKRIDISQRKTYEGPINEKKKMLRVIKHQGETKPQ